MSESVPVLAIDGPSGSGKGTLAQEVANRLGWHLLDSGALYRIIGVMAERRHIDVGDHAAVAEMAASLSIEFDQGAVRADQADLTDAIRTEDAGEQASRVAQIPAVRQAVFKIQRSFAQPPGLVADGRDMGTTLFPEAKLKIFLEASAEERAQRRYKQLKNKGLSVSLPGLLAQIEERDARDRGRAIAPLVPADDAWVIDSTHMTIEEVVDAVMAKVAALGLLT